MGRDCAGWDCRILMDSLGALVRPIVPALYVLLSGFGTRRTIAIPTFTKSARRAHGEKVCTRNHFYELLCILNRATSSKVHLFYVGADFLFVSSYHG